MFWTIEPPSADRMELAIARVTAMVASIGSKAGVNPLDFLPSWNSMKAEDEPPETDDGLAPDRIMAVMDGFMERQNRRMKQAGQ